WFNPSTAHHLLLGSVENGKPPRLCAGRLGQAAFCCLFRSAAALLLWLDGLRSRDGFHWHPIRLFLRLQLGWADGVLVRAFGVDGLRLAAGNCCIRSCEAKESSGE